MIEIAYGWSTDKENFYHRCKDGRRSIYVRDEAGSDLSRCQQRSCGAPLTDNVKMIILLLWP